MFKQLSIVALWWSLVCVSVPAEGVDVRSVGAKGDGVTDDTAAFVKALASGRDVYVPAGQYLLKSISVPDRTRLRGSGPGSVLILDASCHSKHLLALGSGCVVEDLALTGGLSSVPRTQNEEPCLVHVDGRENVTIRDLHIYDYGFTGIGCRQSTDLRIMDNTLWNLNEGIRLRHCRRAMVRDNAVRGMKFHGIEFWGNSEWKAQTSSDLIFVGNVVRDGGGGAIWGAGTKRLIMSGNIVDGATDVGLDPEWCSEIGLCGNVARRCENAAISLFFSCHNATVFGNAVVNDRPVSKEDAEREWFVRSASG